MRYFIMYETEEKTVLSMDDVMRDYENDIRGTEYDPGTFEEFLATCLDYNGGMWEIWQNPRFEDRVAEDIKIAAEKATLPELEYLHKLVTEFISYDLSGTDLYNLEYYILLRKYILQEEENKLV